MSLLDGGSSAERDITFRFCSREEGRLYRLASHLKESGYHITVNQSAHETKWVCEASKRYSPDTESLEWLCFDMLELADRREVVFESWETVIPVKRI